MSIDPDQHARFHQQGFLHLPGLFQASEVDALRRVAKEDPQLAGADGGGVDGAGRRARMCLWNDPPPGIYGAIACSRRLVLTATALLGEEVYHWHSKIMLKDPHTGGAWEWHQDYGYWYGQCLRPDLLSCAIAIDPATRSNGCLQVLTGSHRFGRIDHGRVGSQTGADPERVALIAERCPLHHAEMAAGDALFFHSNTLHRSDDNRSADPRWLLICCFNTRSNSPPAPLQGGHPPYRPLSLAADDAVLHATSATN